MFSDNSNVLGICKLLQTWDNISLPSLVSYDPVLFVFDLVDGYFNILYSTSGFIVVYWESETVSLLVRVDY